jgi:23S rRNA pseudouridine1911/1915/1917 synthase
MLKSYKIDEKFANNRLDISLCALVGHSRNQVQAAVKNGFVTVNGKKTTKPSTKLQYQDEITLETFENKKKSIDTYEFETNIKFDIKIIYEDKFILIINKPSGLVIHQAPTVHEPTLVDWLKFKNISLSTLGHEIRYGIVHRLDKGTSGVMVVAKTNKAHESLSAQLEQKTMGRFYVAIIDQPLKDDITIDKPIGRDRNVRIRMSTSNPQRHSKTAFKKFLTSIDGTKEIVLCKLYTGRTHQIRAHLNFINRHIIGDKLYNFKGKDDKIMLHAFVMYLNHPNSGERLIFKAQFDDKFDNYIKENFNQRSSFEKINDDDFDDMFDSIE